MHLQEPERRTRDCETLRPVPKPLKVKPRNSVGYSIPTIAPHRL